MELFYRLFVLACCVTVGVTAVYWIWKTWEDEEDENTLLQKICGTLFCAFFLLGASVGTYIAIFDKI